MASSARRLDRRGRREHTGDGLSQGGDHAANQAIDVGQQERLVRHGA